MESAPARESLRTFIGSRDFHVRTRHVQVLFTALVIPLVFLMTRVLTGSAGAGLVAASLIGLSWELNTHARFIAVDTLFMLFGPIVLTVLCRNLRRGRPLTQTDLAVAAFCAGLAGGTKYTAILLVLPVVLAQYTLTELPLKPWPRRLLTTAGLAACCLTRFLLINPGLFLDPVRFQHDLAYGIWDYTRARQDYPYASDSAWERLWIMSRYLFGTVASPYALAGILLGFASFSGLVVFVRHEPRLVDVADRNLCQGTEDVRGLPARSGRARAVSPQSHVPAFADGGAGPSQPHRDCDAPDLGFTRFLLVDDGSAEHPLSRLDPDLMAEPLEIVRLRHAVNLGKGAALKTGINEYLNRVDAGAWNTPGLITVDADGQHRPADVHRVARGFLAHPDALCLGLREFSGAVPWRSRLGNQLTRLAFRFFCGADLGDTQTGLRAIPNDLLPELLSLSGQRYAYELEMLVHASRQQVPIQHVGIETVYLDGNRGSHFNPLLDSMRVYFVFLRFSFSSLLTFAVDTILFMLAFKISGLIGLSTAAARLGAGTCNFLINRSLVFHSGNRWLFEMARYWGAVAILGTISVFGVSRLTASGWGLLPGKIATELLLFVASFPIQRLFVFASASRRRVTDWTSYYERPGKFTGLSRPVTYRKILDCFRRFAGEPGAIAEFGGANSRIYDLLAEQYPASNDQVFDLNEAGNDLFRVR
ncbi:MAG: glycosyltransferase family 39 protein, partial [Verrucomicrobia bacterium]|nr:glycosyltransferase family 39 protein [Verrucomicrobiota bacterium]